MSLESSSTEPVLDARLGDTDVQLSDDLGRLVTKDVVIRQREQLLELKD